MSVQVDAGTVFADRFLMNNLKVLELTPLASSPVQIKKIETDQKHQVRINTYQRMNWSLEQGIALCVIVCLLMLLFVCCLGKFPSSLDQFYQANSCAHIW